MPELDTEIAVGCDECLPTEAANIALRRWNKQLQKSLEEGESKREELHGIVLEMIDERDTIVEEITEAVVQKLRDTPFYVCLRGER